MTINFEIQNGLKKIMSEKGNFTSRKVKAALYLRHKTGCNFTEAIEYLKNYFTTQESKQSKLFRIK